MVSKHIFCSSEENEQRLEEKFVEERLPQHPCQAFVKEGAGTLADLFHTKAGPRSEATSE
jgi:hypothetical protein